MRDRALFGGLTALLAIAIIAVGLASMYPGAMQGGSSTLSTSGGTSSAGSMLGGAQTVLATLASSTMTGAPSTSTTLSTSSVTTSMTSSAVTTSSSSGGDSYSVTPSSQVQVISVAAVVPQTGEGGGVTFSVQFKNIGGSDIYVLSGGGSGLNVTVTSGATLISQVAGPRCEIAAAMAQVAPGSTWTDTVPGCWSGVTYKLTGSGTIGVELVLSWSDGTTQGSGGNSVTINAEFTLS